VVAIHFRAGDAARLAWRSQAPLGSYVRQALCAATALAAAPPWGLFLASDSVQARAALSREVALHIAIVSFDASVAPPGAPLLQACGGRMGAHAPSSVTVSSAAMLVTTAQAVPQDAHVHIETWIAEQRERLRSAEDDEGADAAYLAHLVHSTAALPGGAPHLRVFALHRHSYSLYSEAADVAHHALDDALHLLLDGAAGSSSTDTALLCKLAMALAGDLGRGSDDRVGSLAGACGMAASPAAAPAAAAENAAAAAAIAGVTAGIVADVSALAASAALVGTCLSQVSRLAYELSFAAGVARLPPVALDAHLCAGAPHAHAILAEWRAPV
jgi:hypothetical protein